MRQIRKAHRQKDEQWALEVFVGRAVDCENHLAFEYLHKHIAVYVVTR